MGEMAWIQNVPGIIKNVTAILSNTAGINDRNKNKFLNTGKLH